MNLWNKILNSSGLRECESIANHLCASVGKGENIIHVQGVLKGSVQKITNISGALQKIEPIKGLVSKTILIKGKLQKIDTIKGQIQEIKPLKGTISKC